MTPLEAKLRRIEALRSENEEDAHPSFVRIARLDDRLTDEEVRERAAPIGHWETDTPVIADALGAGGAEAFARHCGPSLGSMLIPAMVMLAFALGWLLAAMS